MTGENVHFTCPMLRHRKWKPHGYDHEAFLLYRFMKTISYSLLRRCLYVW